MHSGHVDQGFAGGKQAAVHSGAFSAQVVLPLNQHSSGGEAQGNRAGKRVVTDVIAYEHLYPLLEVADGLVDGCNLGIHGALH